MDTKIIVSVCISIVLIGGTLYVISQDKTLSARPDAPQAERNVEIRDGVQYVTVTAQGGYSPRFSDIQSGIPTKLVVKTNGTYDCSASLVIRDVEYQKILPSTGEEVIDLGTLKSGQKMQGVCGMGMYNFSLQAK